MNTILRSDLIFQTFPQFPIRKQRHLQFHDLSLETNHAFFSFLYTNLLIAVPGAMSVPEDTQS